MSARNTCALKLGGGGLINSPVLDSLCSLDIGVKYVFVFLNIIITLNVTQRIVIYVYFSWIKCPIFLMSYWLLNFFITLWSSWWVWISRNHSATLCCGDNANQSYQHTFEGRMGTNWHESYVTLIFWSSYFWTSHSCGSCSESSTPNLEVVTPVPNERAL